MNKNARRIIALIALAAIAVLIIAFSISALTAAPGESGNRFMGLLFCIIAVPVLAWLTLFCVGRMQNKHTMAELFPEQPDPEEPGEKRNQQN
ncbi:MAG: hypothetical protein K2N95_12730 [Lachnospiraceae bacterium]|nr:hypothetical protein [Lachnospiraceae bacterium]